MKYHQNQIRLDHAPSELLLTARGLAVSLDKDVQEAIRQIAVCKFGQDKTPMGKEYSRARVEMIQAIGELLTALVDGHTARLNKDNAPHFLYYLGLPHTQTLMHCAFVTISRALRRLPA